MTTFAELVESHDDPKVDNEGVAKAVLDDLLALDQDEQHAALLGLVLDAVRLSRRNVVRRLESTQSSPADPSAGRRRILDERFFVSPQRGYVLWGEATVEDHLIRAAYLRQMAGGLVGTAEKHEEAAKRLRNTGAVCLYDLEKVPA